jgi:hypothetical protein
MIRKQQEAAQRKKAEEEATKVWCVLNTWDGKSNLTSGHNK